MTIAETMEAARHKRVHVVCMDGRDIVDTVEGFENEWDSEYDECLIYIGDWGILEHEIESIEILS